jgi:hypothetical protein
MLTTKRKHYDSAIWRPPPAAFATRTTRTAARDIAALCRQSASIDGKIPARRNHAEAAKLPTLLIGPYVGFSPLNAAVEPNGFVFAS